MSEAFFDSNILLYLLSDDVGKADQAERLLEAGGVVSVQVLNEFAAVARRKAKLGWPEIREVLATIRVVCRVVPLTVEAHDTAIDLAERYGFSIYDSLIIAAAIEARCDTLYSEDLQHKQKVGSIVILNPFSLH